MLAVGIIYGLAAAAGQSVSFLFSRRFIVNGHGNVGRLLALGHVMMGTVAAVLLAIVWDESASDVGNLLLNAALASGFYLVGQLGFLAAIRQTQVSRVSPLLGLKVAAVAPISMWLLSTHVTPWQWIAIAMSVFGGFLLNRIGGQLPLKTIGGTVFAVVMFAFSDIYIIKTVEACGDGFVATTRAVCLSYSMCGLAGLVALPWYGSRRLTDWRAAAPYALVWLPSMFGLFASLAICGAVLGNLVIATRGLFSIVLGVVLAHSGFHHLEQHVARSVLVRRIAAAVLMMAAIGLFGWAAR